MEFYAGTNAAVLNIGIRCELDAVLTWPNRVIDMATTPVRTCVIEGSGGKLLHKLSIRYVPIHPFRSARESRKPTQPRPFRNARFHL